MDSYVQGVEIMSKGGSSSTGTTTTRIEADPQLKELALRNYEFAQNIATQPYTTYGGPRIAEFTPTQQSALANLAQAGLQGPGVSAVDAARDIAQYQTQPLAQAMTQFYNPFQKQVIDTAMQNIETQRQLQQQQNAANAIRARAFGGSRQGIVEGLTNQAALMAAGQTAGQLASQGFTQAGQLGAQDIQNRLAQAGQLASLGAAQQAIRQQQAQQALSAGGTQQAMNQANLDLAYQDFLRQQGYPLQQLGILQSALSGIPASQTQSQISPIYRNVGSSILGGALAGNTLGPSLGLGAGGGALFGGLLGLL